MSNINDLIYLNEKNRLGSAKDSKQAAIDDTSKKLREAVGVSFLKLGQGLIGSTPHGKQALQFLTPYFGMMAIGKALTEGFMANAGNSKDLKSIEDDILKLEQKKANSPTAPTAPISGPSLRAAS